MSGNDWVGSQGDAPPDGHQMPKKKGKKPKTEVEDHGNGFMVVGTGSIHIAKRILTEYVDDILDYRYALPIQYDGRSSVWLTTAPGEHWDGARDHTGQPMER